MQDEIKDEQSYEKTVSKLMKWVEKGDDLLLKTYAMQVLSRVALTRSRAEINQALFAFFVKMLDSEESLAAWASKGLGHMGRRKAVLPLLNTIRTNEPGELTLFCLESIAKLLPFVQNDPVLSLETFEILMEHLPKCDASPQNKSLALMIRKTLLDLDNLLLVMQSISNQKKTDSLYSNLILLGDELAKILNTEKKIDEYRLINILELFSQNLAYGDREIKLLTLWYLGNYQNPVVTESLVKILEAEKDPQVLYMASWALLSLNNQSARNMVLRLNEREENYSREFIQKTRNALLPVPDYKGLRLKELENNFFCVKRLREAWEKAKNR